MLHYAYLWRREERAGRVEGRKDRPCVVLTVDDETVPGGRIVLLVPITHSPPESPEDGFALPADTKRRLGLDDQPSWVIVTECNRFTWRGYDVRPTPDGRESYGVLPVRHTRLLRQALADTFQRNDSPIVDRDD